MKRDFLSLGLLCCLASCATPNQGREVVTTAFLSARGIQMSYCAYQGADAATGKRKVLTLRKPEASPCRLVLRFDNNSLFGDDQKSLQRFEITHLPEVYIQTWEWEHYVSGDLGLRRPVKIRNRKVPRKLLEQIYSKGDYPSNNR